MNIKNVALVTGASSGIGEALSRELIARGWSVIGIARSLDKLSQIQKELGNAFTPIVCDVSNSEDIKIASTKILDRGICPSHFFLNAGLAGEKVIENPNSFDVTMHEKIMAVNYFGVLRWLQYWEKPCQENGGANFIVTSSMNAIFAPPTGSAYSASKAAISKAFESLSLTYFEKNLKFSVVYAGPVATEGLKGNVPFIWKPEKMAKYMVDCASKGKVHCEPSLFYSIVTRFLNKMPYSWTMKLLNKLG
ncbi:MAG: SDR family oxidoreductase [Parachlamydiaceae bacterium]|nr:SDR family oxidoreductase [Parachlamydiaceae bacterium]